MSEKQQTQYAQDEGVQLPQEQQEDNQQLQQNGIPSRPDEYRAPVIRESRIKDRPYRKMNDSLKVKIELDLEVEVDLYARVKGDVTIGLM